jgi:NAD-dependent dihydropyrimidine dehydrogenase PreA subunit
LPIDPNFQANRTATVYENLKVWKDNASNLGIYGTDVAVDFDQGSGADRKALPARERDCIYCFGCEAVCPKFAIRVTKP